MTFLNFLRWFGLFVKWYISGLFYAEVILLEKEQSNYLTYRWLQKEVQGFQGDETGSWCNSKDQVNKSKKSLAQVAEAVKYTNCISAEGQDLPNQCSVFNIINFDCEVPEMMELWGMQSTSSLQLLPDPLWPGMVAPDRVPCMGQIELNCTYTKLNCLK